MTRKSKQWITIFALILILLGFAEDLTGILLIVGIVTSVAGGAILVLKGRK